MKISVVTKYFSPSVGGGERQLLYFLSAMNGHAKVDIFTAQNRPELPDLISHARLHAVPENVRDLEERIAYTVRKALNSRNKATALYLVAYQKAAVPEQARLLEEFSHNGIPTIVRFSSLGEASEFVSQCPDSGVFKNINRVLCLSPSITEELRELGCPEDRLFSFMNPVDLHLFPLRRAQKISRTRKFVVLSRPHSKKNWKMILEAWFAADLESSQLSFVYSDNETPALIDHVKEMQSLAMSFEPKSPVRFIKTDQFDDVPDLISDYDVMISASQNEGMQNSLLEGLASGLRLLVPQEQDFAFLPTDFAAFYKTTKGLVRCIRKIAELPPLTNSEIKKIRDHLALNHGLTNYHEIAKF